MQRSKITLGIGLLLLALIAGSVWWIFFRLTPQQRFEREVLEMVKVVNEGGHLKVQEKFSPEFHRFILNQGINPQQVLLACRQIDQNQNAQYAFLKTSLFVENDFAEAQFSRHTADGTAGFYLPFVYRDRHWWISDHFRSNQSWDPLETGW